MKKVRSIVNIVLGSLIAALGLSGCERYVKYGAPVEEYGFPYDTTVRAMYGVNPNVNIDWDEEAEENN